MIIVRVEDTLFGQPPSRISHFSPPQRNDITDCKRAYSNEGVFYCGKRIRTVPDDMTPGGLALRQDRVCEDAL